MSTMALGRLRQTACDALRACAGSARQRHPYCLRLLVSVLFPMLWSATLGFLLVGLAPLPLSRSATAWPGNPEMIPSMALASVSTIGFLGF
ncbi:MAG: hypothetical protein ACLT38_12420 [Akkermansia sp.]